MTKWEVTKYFSCTMETFYPYVAHRAMVSELKWIFSNFCIRSHVSYVGCRIVDIWHRSRGNFGTLCTQRSVFTVITIVLSDTPGGFILMWREIKHSLYTVQKLSETEISAHQARKLKPTKTRIHPGFLIPGFGSAGTFAALCTQRPDCTVMTTGLNYKIPSPWDTVEWQKPLRQGKDKKL